MVLLFIIESFSASVSTALRISSQRFPLRLHRLARSNIAYVTLAGFGNGVWYWSALPRLTQSLRLHPAESSGVRVRALPLRLSASAQELYSHRDPPPPNNSFKPTPHRGVNSVLCATLHAVATPTRGGLTQALGGRKAFGGLLFSAVSFFGFAQHCSSYKFSGLSASVTSLGALIHRTRHVGRLRKRCLVWSAFPRLTQLLR